MKCALVLLGILAFQGLEAGAPAPAEAQAGDTPVIDLTEGLDRLEVALRELGSVDDREAFAARALALYLDIYEPIEVTWGPGGVHGTDRLAARIAEGEAAFHRLLRAGSVAERRARADELVERLSGVRQAAATSAVPLVASPTLVIGETATAGQSPARTGEVRAMLDLLERGRSDYRDGSRRAALAAVEEAYLEGFEPLESRLPSSIVSRVEQLVHLGVRPAMARGASVADVEERLDALRAALLTADQELARGSGFGFAVFNSFVIIVREGLEAVLLVAAMLAYLGAARAPARHRRQIYLGVAAGVGASLLTWLVARTLLPVSGANRELLEGFTALAAVAVLLYVSHWLFHKSYVVDWKNYLKRQVGEAVSSGSSLAMAGLAFAAVYREGFETVLFYQALAFDAGGTAVLAGFLPGAVLILGVGIVLIRLGVKLPIKRVFTVTNAILLYLAFVFLGKGIYNLQEGGLFAPHPLPGLPDNEALRQLLGFYPLAETLLAQAAFLALLISIWVVYRVGVRREPAPAATVETAGSSLGGP